jgi:hypothetical protein
MGDFNLEAMGKSVLSSIPLKLIETKSRAPKIILREHYGWRLNPG